MKCYKHNETDALGICKSCQKGVCRECIVDVEGRIACKDSCEQEVKDLNEMILKNKGVYQKTSSNFYRVAAIYGFIGLFFIFYPLLVTPILINFLVPVGIIFLLAMVMTIYSGRKFQK